MLLGIIAALSASFFWTYGCFLWRKQTKFLSPININLIKNIIAFILFSPLLITIDFNYNLKGVLLLLISGMLGISIGDSLYIASLRILGTRRTLSIEALAPILASLLGSIWLRESQELRVWIGILLVTLSLLCIALRKTEFSEPKHTEISLAKGYFFAFLSVLFAVVAASLSRLALNSSNINPFQSTEIRLFGSLLLLGTFNNINLNNMCSQLSLDSRKDIIYATFLGTNLGILLQQYVFQNLPLGLGWTLLSTSPLISLFFASAEGEVVDYLTILMSISVIIGVAIVFL